MKRLVNILLLLFVVLHAQAQLPLRTLVTQGPVMAGEPFQVQYVMEDVTEEDKFFQPDFKPFRFVSGPNRYTGDAYSSNGPIRLYNIVFTLLAPKPGTYTVPGAVASILGEKE